MLSLALPTLATAMETAAGSVHRGRPPETTITKRPKPRTPSNRVTFAFRSSKPASRFACRLDGARFKPCRSPKTYRDLKPEAHLFEVRAIDRQGRTDPTPAKWAFRVVPQNLYVALGTSVTAGAFARSPSSRYVGLLFSYYQSVLGVTTLSNLARFGETSGSMRRGGQLAAALARINSASDTRAVTIEIGGNDRLECADSEGRWIWASCPVRSNLAATLSSLRAALDRDPGDETFVAMAYYNPASGLGGDVPFSGESWWERGLLGSDLTVSCLTSAGPEVGLNDIIFQEAGRYGASVANAHPAFKVGGQGFMFDELHPNDAGHAAIADAFRIPSAECGSSPT